MAYITYEQYVTLYGASAISQEDFPIYAQRASDLIDSITQYRIPRSGGISALAAWVQELIQNAAAAQVLYFSQLGLESILTGQTGQSFTVGKVSVSGGGLANGNMTGAQLMVSPLAVSLLEQTGLLFRGVHVCSDRYLNPFWGI